MKNITQVLLAAAAIAAITSGSATAMPKDSLAGLTESKVHDVRVVCDRYGRRCYNTRRAYRSRYVYRSHPYYARPYYGGGYYSGSPAYGYYGGPRVGVGIGPFGFGVW